MQTATASKNLYAVLDEARAYHARQLDYMSEDEAGIATWKFVKGELRDLGFVEEIPGRSLAILEQSKTDTTVKARVTREQILTPDPVKIKQRVNDTQTMQEALISRVKRCEGEIELQAVKLEMEYITIHHMARMNVWDAMRERLGEIYK